MKPIKNKPKCQEWERRRRKKLNQAFNILSQLLPNYDPAKNLAKIDVLERSTDFVKELRLSNSRLVSHQVESDEKCKLIKQLQDEVNKLILRVKQLTALLKTASIPIPSGPSISLGKRKLKWSGKVLDPGNNSVEKVSDEENSLGTINEKDVEGKVDANKGAEDSTGPNTLITSNPLKEVNGPVLSVGEESSKNEASTKDKPKPSTSRLKRKATSSSPTKAKVGVTSSDKSPNKPPPQLQTPSFQPLIQNGTMIPLLNSSPITAVFTEPPKSTTATMLPMQTIFLTSTPNVINSQAYTSPLITRIALGPSHHQLFSQSLDGRMTEILQKVPIQSIRKPIPKIKHKRKRRKLGGDVITKETITIATPPVPQEAKMTQDNDIHQKENDTLSTATENSKDPDSDNNKPKSVDTRVSESPAESNKAVPIVPETEIILSANDKELPTVPSQPSELAEHVKSSTNDLMQIQLFAHEPEVMEVDATSLDAIPSPSSSSRVLCELQSRKKAEPEIEQRETVNSSEEVLEKEAKSTIQKEIVSEQLSGNENFVKKSSGISQNTSISTPTTTITSTDTSSRAILPIDNPRTNIDTVPTFLQETTPSNNDTVSGDKISECIARSMDLIDAPDGELMELGDNWSTNSPKSPISPTQMFLSMFPLLPKENIVSASESNQIVCLGVHSSSMSLTNPRLIPSTGYTSHAHRSFFIDSMLPDENQVAEGVTGGPNSRQQAQYKNLNLEQGKSSRNSSENTTSAKVTDSNIIPLVTALASRPFESVSPKKIVSKPSTLSANQPNKAVGDKDHRRPPTTIAASATQGQGSFKDLHLFNSDSVDFSTLHTLPFTQFDQMDIFRGESSSSRSRPGLFDPIFSLNLDQTGYGAQPISATATPSSHFPIQQPDISENIHQNFQFHVNSDQRSTEILPSSGENNCPRANPQKTPYFSHTPQSTSHNKSQSHHHQDFVSNYSSVPNYSSPVVNPPPKATLPKHSSAFSHQTQSNTTKQLFRPQVPAENQAAPNPRPQHAPQLQSPKSNAKRYAPQQTQKSLGLSKENAKTVQENYREISHSSQHLEPLSQQKSHMPTPTACLPKPSSTDKRKTAVANPKKSRNTRAEPTPFDSKTHHKNQKEQSNTKDTVITKKSSMPEQGKQSTISCQPTENFHQFAASSSATDLFNPISQPHFFPHSSNQQSLDHSNMNLNIFPEFSLPDCNPHYDHYSMDFNFSSGGNISNQSQFQSIPNSSNNGVTQTQPQSHHTPAAPSHQQNYHQPSAQPQSNPRSSRPTPFYLQDVNCDNFNNFEGQTSNPNQSHQQIVHPSAPSVLSNLNPQNHHYGNNASNFSSATHHSQPQIHQSHHPTETNPDSAISTGHYFQTSANPHSQHSQPVSAASVYPHTILPRQTASTQQLNVNPNSLGGHGTSRNGQIHANQQQHHSQYINPQPPQMKTKPTPVSSINQPLYATSSNNANNNTRVPPLPAPGNVTSSSSSHRSSQLPVNWMTDNQAVPTSIPTAAHNIFPTNKPNVNTSTAVITNPFSVSKLVGTTTSGSASGNANTKSQAHTLTRQNSSSNYCAEALIRKNPTAISTQNFTTQSGWHASTSVHTKPQSQGHNFFQSTISSPTHTHNFHAQHPSQHSSSSYNSHLQDSTFGNGGYNLHNNPPNSQSHPHNRQSYEPFNHTHQSLGNSQQQHLNFQPHSNQPSNPHLQNIGSDSIHGGTSVSNFNLSTIFPEINDKQRNSSSSVARNSNNTPSTSIGGGNNNNSMTNPDILSQNRASSTSASANCGYYSQQQHSSHGRNK